MIFLRASQTISGPYRGILTCMYALLSGPGKANILLISNNKSKEKPAISVMPIAGLKGLMVSNH